jgi:hypothetical protein
MHCKHIAVQYSAVQYSVQLNTVLHDKIKTTQFKMLLL